MTSPAYDPDNVFAKILRGELPAKKVYEDEHTIAIMDIMPQAKGHTLVLPKQPSRNILDIDPDELCHVMKTAQKIARAIKKAFNADGILVKQYVEAAAGQTVFHTHVHVLPRFEGVPLKHHGGEMADSDLLAKNAEAIRAALAELEDDHAS